MVLGRFEAGDRALFERLYRTMPRAEVVALREEVLAELARAAARSRRRRAGGR